MVSGMDSMKNEKKLLEEIIQRLETIERRLDNLERRSASLEGGKRSGGRGLTPSLLKVLSYTKKSGGIIDPGRLANALDIPRNIASLYLNRLSEMGYLMKNVNLDPRIRARYIFELREDKIDEKLKKLMEEVWDEQEKC